VPVPDTRLDQITTIFKPEKTIATNIEFVDIAGLVRGASKGEGLGNQFLGHIKQVDAVAHIVRCFDDPNIVHVEGNIDPKRDIDTIDTELCLADLDTVTRAHDRSSKGAKSGDKELIAKTAVLLKVKEGLEKGHPARFLQLSPEERLLIRDLQLLTAKPILFVCNVAEGTVGQPNAWVDAVKELAKKENAVVVEISAKVEAEIAQLSKEERKGFLEELGLKESGLDRVIRAAYELLGLITYFTAGPKEVRAWTIHKGMKAPQAAGVIHSDFERGFICAEIYHYNDLISQGSEANIKSKGLMRLEGKEYPMKDGDVAHFRFNV